MRLARSSEGLLARGGGGALANELAAWQDEPWLTLAALVDGHGRVLADSANRWVGQSARTTPLAPAIALVAHHRGDGLARLQKAHEARVFGAYQVALASDTAGWALVVFDRADAVAQARADARRQLRWSAMAIALLCFALWAALHFGFAARLARLARMLRDFGEGRAVNSLPCPAATKFTNSPPLLRPWPRGSKSGKSSVAGSSAKPLKSRNASAGASARSCTTASGSG